MFSSDFWYLMMTALGREKKTLNKLAWIRLKSLKRDAVCLTFSRVYFHKKVTKPEQFLLLCKFLLCGVIFRLICGNCSYTKCVCVCVDIAELDFWVIVTLCKYQLSIPISSYRTPKIYGALRNPKANPIVFYATTT